MSKHIKSSEFVYPDTPERRRFNRRERVALFLAAGGHCAACGVALPAGWHADHVAPYVTGGLTDVVNGQALCPDCNLKKGADVSVAERTFIEVQLREWQRWAKASFNSKPRKDFLCVATPGAGKTTFALEIAVMLLQGGRVNRICVVVPTRHLRKQWMDAAAKFGVQLDPNFANRLGREARDFDGVVVTYQQVAADATIHRALCGTPTFVIFDEIHHSGVNHSWGDALSEAFEYATIRLAITGTPFRSDAKDVIPFINYLDGRSVADFSYGYGDALRDGVCRPVFFPSYDGNMRWWSERGGELTATFRDDIPTEEDTRRLSTALDPHGEWLPTVLRDADARLLELRQSQYEHAAGLVIAKDQFHAREIAKILARITGEVPAVAVSDEPDASGIIEEFADGRASRTGDPLLGQPRWLVAVKMVSEGVDIPRLFVGVYATTVMTELYFRQVVGRFVRMMANVNDQAAYLFIPEVDKLIEYVLRIKEERDHVLDASEEEIEEAARERQQRLEGFGGQPWQPLQAEAREGATYHNEERIAPLDLAEARKFMMASGYEGMDAALVALFMRKHLDYIGFVNEGVVPTVPASDPLPSLSRRKESLRKDIQRLVSRFCAATGCTHKNVYAALNKRTMTNQDKADEAQLIKRKDVLKGVIELATTTDRRLSEWEWDEVIVDGRQPVS